MGKLDGRTAIITGAAGGQGEAQARLFAAEGARVLIADIKDDEGRSLAAELDGSARFFHLDVSSRRGWDAITRAISDWPPVTVLINNAGIHWVRPIEFEEEEEILRMWRINLLGPLLGMQIITPIMRDAGGGSIVNVSSTAGLQGVPYLAAYSTSKWGLRGLTKTAALEFGSSSIRVNSIHPGPVDTAMLRSSPRFLAQDPGERFSHVPLTRAGMPSEVAQLSLFLASDDSSFITGAEIAIDGGLTAGRPSPFKWTAGDGAGVGR